MLDKARIELRTTPDVKKQLQQAAAEEGLSLNQFMLNAAIAAAKRVVLEEQARTNRNFFDELTRTPSQPTSALRELVNKYRLEIRSGSGTP